MLRPMRGKLVAGLAIGLAAVTAAPADAGTYDVHACRTPSGAAAPADGWTAAANGAFMYAAVGCPGGTLSASADPAVVHARGSTLAFRFDPPAATLVARWDVRRRLQLTNGPDWGWNYTSFVDEIQFGSALTRETCWSTGGCPGLDGSWQGAGPARALIMLVDCSSGPPGDCQPGGRAEMSVSAATVTLEDVADPVFTGAPTGSALDGARRQSGVVAASFSASDAGGGVATAVLEVDGTPAASQTVGGDTCAPPYTRAVPCKPTASGTVSWDSRTVPNGVHQVRLLVYDASGTNHAAAGPYTVRIRNRGVACAPSSLPVQARWKGRRAARRTVGFRRRARVLGRAGAGGARVVLFDAATGRALRDTTARANGRFALRAPATRTRRLVVGVPAAGARYACSRRLTLRVRAGLTLRVRPRAVRNGERVRLSGKLRGGAIPPKGKLVELQAHEAGRWRTFASLRSDRRGRFATNYRFQRTFVARTYRFRARARAEAGYPFVLGVSPSARVRVTP
jgi:hypothetical protein